MPPLLLHGDANKNEWGTKHKNTNIATWKHYLSKNSLQFPQFTIFRMQPSNKNSIMSLNEVKLNMKKHNNIVKKESLTMVFASLPSNKFVTRRLCFKFCSRTLVASATATSFSRVHLLKKGYMLPSRFMDAIIGALEPVTHPTESFCLHFLTFGFMSLQVHLQPFRFFLDFNLLQVQRAVCFPHDSVGVSRRKNCHSGGWGGGCRGRGKIWKEGMKEEKGDRSCA